MNSWYFVCDNDFHYRYEKGIPTSSKRGHAETILNLNTTYPIDLVINSGDMTERALDSHPMYVSGAQNEFELYMNDFHRPLEKANIPVYMCIGNHDINKKNAPNMEIFKYIRDRYGATYSWLEPKKSSCYTFMHKNILFMSLGLYPRNIEWFKNNLPQNKSQPIIIFYHFNTKKGERWSDWWSEEEKETFFNIISYYNVILIINGHNHNTRLNKLFETSNEVNPNSPVKWLNIIPNILASKEPVLVHVNDGAINKIYIVKTTGLEELK